MRKEVVAAEFEVQSSNLREGAKALEPTTCRCFRDSPVNQVILGKGLGK
jgi:hypothetical protein